MNLRRSSYAVGLALAAICISCDHVPLTAPNNSTITVSSLERVLPIGGSTQVEATVIESAGTPVHDGTSVRFSTTLGRVDPVEAQTRNGVASTTFLAGDASGIAEVRATSGGAGAGTSTTPSTPTSPTTPPVTTTATSNNVVLITIGSAAVDTVTVRANPSTVSQNGGTVQVTATVVGANGRALANIPVSFSATRGTLSNISGPTDANGEARATLTTNADTDITATAGTKTSTAAHVTAQPGPSVTLTCAVGSVNNCASVAVGDIVTFTSGRAANSSAIASSTLDYGDGQSESLGTLSSPISTSHRYNTAGTYTARLTATDINGESTATSSVITVTDLVATISLNVTNTVTRTVQATATLNAPAATIARYEWSFLPDANPATLTTTTNSATSSFAAAGTKTVSVRVVLTDGRSASASAQINVP
jgi:Bacterial Ig-like domain (group 1)/PKD domain